MAQLTSPWTKHIGHVLGFLPGGILVCDQCEEYVAGAASTEATERPDPDATRLRNWIAEHRTVCPIMRESAAELFATLNEEWAAPEEEREQ